MEIGVLRHCVGLPFDDREGMVVAVSGHSDPFSTTPPPPPPPPPPPVRVGYRWGDGRSSTFACSFCTQFRQSAGIVGANQARQASVATDLNHFSHMAEPCTTVLHHRLPRLVNRSSIFSTKNCGGLGLSSPSFGALFICLLPLIYSIFAILSLSCSVVDAFAWHDAIHDIRPSSSTTLC